jgi:ComF family protein
VKLDVGAFLDLILPRACVGCDAAMGEGIICGLCWSRMPRLAAPQCERCGHPKRAHPSLASASTCSFCLLLPPFVRAARSAFWMDHAASTAAVHALKYDGWTRVAKGMAARMARLPWPTDVCEERSLAVPVPLSTTRLRERGYNQAALLAAPLAERWGIESLPHALERTRHSVSQTRLTPSERAMNVHGAFRVSGAAVSRIAGAHIVLVDDVFTTGATMNAAAAALFESGARIVSYVTFGRARTAAD